MAFFDIGAGTVREGLADASAGTPPCPAEQQ
jgi:hypothetical protein